MDPPCSAVYSPQTESSREGIYWSFFNDHYWQRILQHCIVLKGKKLYLNISVLVCTIQCTGVCSPLIVLDFIFVVVFFVWRKNHYPSISQANWCDMILQLVISYPLIHALVWLESSPNWDSKPGSPAWEADNLPNELSLLPNFSVT